ncbi:MAG: hypothetical protein RQ801_07510 [Spirochaetaceae bacterium]|nr:hypothetical protein [Spirochaetaceae bacterium]MDT8298129.1 hypothetical protein [Spirochaetaceae bacterium]
MSRSTSPPLLRSLIFIILILGPVVGTDSMRESENSEAEYPECRIKMEEQQIQARGIENVAVLRAMCRVPRHLFLPQKEISRAYNDHAVPIGFGQTISQPFIVAY